MTRLSYVWCFLALHSGGGAAGLPRKPRRPPNCTRRRRALWGGQSVAGVIAIFSRISPNNSTFRWSIGKANSGCLDAVSLPWLCSRQDTGDATVTERGLVFEDFADKVDEVFVIGQDGVPAIPLTLKQAERLMKVNGRDAHYPQAINSIKATSGRQASRAAAVNWRRNPAWKPGRSSINVPSQRRHRRFLPRNTAAGRVV